LCVWAGFGGLGYFGLLALYLGLRQHKYYKAEPEEELGEPPHS